MREIEQRVMDDFVSKRERDLMCVSKRVEGDEFCSLAILWSRVKVRQKHGSFNNDHPVLNSSPTKPDAVWNS